MKFGLEPELLLGFLINTELALFTARLGTLAHLVSRLGLTQYQLPQRLLVTVTVFCNASCPVTTETRAGIRKHQNPLKYD